MFLAKTLFVVTLRAVLIVAIALGASASVYAVDPPLPYDINFEVVSSSPFGATVRVSVNATIDNIQMVVLNLEDIRNGVPANLARQQEIKYTEVNRVTLEDFEVKTPIMGEREITIDDVIAVATPFALPGEEITANYSRETTDYLDAVKLANTVTDAKEGEVGSLKPTVIGKIALSDTFKDAPIEVQTELDKILAELPDTITDVVDYDVSIVQQEVKTEIVKNETPRLEQIFSVSEPMILEATVTSGGFYDGTKWGSTGVLALIIDGQYYYDMSHTSWWSTAYAHRIAITIDADNVDADLTNFPLYINISNSSGITNADVTAIFDELGANYLKIVVANADSTAQFYTEVVSWDSVGEVAELHTKVTAIDDLVDTTINLYYDATQADNVAFVGATGSAAGQAVWDSNFVMVYHMNDATTSTLTGSTSLNAVGNKTAANQPIVGDFGVGKGQDFDGTDDVVTVGDSASLSQLGPLTVESYFLQDIQGFEGLLDKSSGVGTLEWGFDISAGGDGRIRFAYYGDTPGSIAATGTADLSDAAWHYSAATWDGVDAAGHINIYADGVLEVLTLDSRAGDGATLVDTSAPIEIGRLIADNTYAFDGKISETRISNIVRSAAYVKLTNYSLTDAAVTFGNAGTLDVDTNAASSIASTSATLNGEIVDLENQLATTRGFEWDIDSGAPYANSWSENGNYTDGTFDAVISSFDPEGTYYFRAFATDSDGTVYGAELSFTTLVGGNSETWAMLLLLSIGLTIISLRFYNLLLSFVAMLFWIATWGNHLANRPAVITQGSFLDEVMIYAFIIMAVVTMLVYFRPRGSPNNIVLGNSNNEGSPELPRVIGGGMMDMSNEEYRNMIRKKLKDAKRK